MQYVQAAFRKNISVQTLDFIVLTTLVETEILSTWQVKVKVVPYTFVRRGVPVREDTCPEPSACEVGWPVPFLAAFISPVLPPGTHLLLAG